MDRSITACHEIWLHHRIRMLHTVCLIDLFSWNSILCVETWKVGIIIMKSHSYFQCIWSLPPTFQISTWNLKIKPDSVTSSDGTIHFFYVCELPLCWRDVFLASGYKLAWDAFIIVFIWVWIIVIRKQWAVKWIDFLYQHKIGLSKWAVMSRLTSAWESKIENSFSKSLSRPLRGWPRKKIRTLIVV